MSTETPGREDSGDEPLAEFHGRPVLGHEGSILIVGPAPATPTADDRAALVRALALILVASAKRDEAPPLAEERGEGS